MSDSRHFGQGSGCGGANATAQHRAYICKKMLLWHDDPMAAAQRQCKSHVALRLCAGHYDHQPLLLQRSLLVGWI
jgi:hypothetical protein